jgi:hypothetical protein
VRWLVDWSNQSQFVALLVGELSISLSAVRFGNFRVDAFPDSVSPFKKIRTETLGRSVPEGEDLITLNLEELPSCASWLRAFVPRRSAECPRSPACAAPSYQPYSTSSLSRPVYQSFGCDPEPEMPFGDGTLGSAAT